MFQYWFAFVTVFVYICYECHHQTLILLKWFLAWRIGNPQWRCVNTQFKNCPKQGKKSMDCAVFVLRIVYNIITDILLNFTLEDISNEHFILAMRLLMHPNNEYQISSV